MIITRALAEHLEEINNLLSTYQHGPLPAKLLNKYDIAIIAKDEGKIIGFVWCGLMGNRTIGYIDYFTIDQKYAEKGVGTKMIPNLVRLLTQKGVKQVITSIQHDNYHDKSIASAYRLGLKAMPQPFTTLIGDVAEMTQKLGVN